jgi:tetratricopeptide (TPR) repeat protein
MYSEKNPNLIERSEQIDLDEGVKCLNRGFFQEALVLYNGILNRNPVSHEGEAGYRTTKFWINRLLDVESSENKTGKIHKIIENWEQYENYAKTHQMDKSRAYFALLGFVHRKLTIALPNMGNIQSLLGNDYRIITRLGEIFLKLEDWHNAVYALESARSLKKEDPYILALLGESYYQTDNIHRALVMLREAFFINPGKVPLKLLKSKPIREMISEMANAGIKPEHQAEWLPIFATLYGIFHIKRGLSRQQLENLNRNTLKLEENFRSSQEHPYLLPRLLNHYIWLLDYYLVQENMPEIGEEILTRIKSLDTKVHEILIKTYQHG